MVAIPEDVLNDIFSRFIIPEAKSNANDYIRLCFAIEVRASNQKGNFFEIMDLCRTFVSKLLS